MKGIQSIVIEGIYIYSNYINMKYINNGIKIVEGRY